MVLVNGSKAERERERERVSVCVNLSVWGSVCCGSVNIPCSLETKKKRTYYVKRKCARNTTKSKRVRNQ